jgi:peptidoglycan/LPS O-acetylase OafA/YrhL
MFNDRPSGAPGRLAFVDGLRAVALAGVAAYELVAFTRSPHPPAILLAAASAAANCLALFFVLSGFLLALPVLGKLRQAGRADFNLARYAAKRAGRILPAFVAALAATVALPLVAQQLGISELRGHGPPAVGVLRTLLFSGTSLGNDGFWTLALIVRCYAAFPLLLLLWNRWPRLFVALATMAAVLDAETSAHAWGLGAFVPFMLGIVAADVEIRRPALAGYAALLAGGACAAALALDPLLARLPGPVGGGAPFPENPLFALAFAALIVAAARTPAFARRLSWVPLAAAGRASYAASLAGVPAIAFVSRHAAGSDQGWLAAESAALAVAAAYVLFRLVEAPAAHSAWLAAALERVPSSTMVLVSRVPRARRDGAEPAAYGAPEAARVKLPVVSLRFGSFDDLAAEIFDAKQRLAQQSAPLFASERARCLPVLGPRVRIQLGPALSTSEALSV